MRRPFLSLLLLLLLVPPAGRAAEGDPEVARWVRVLGTAEESRPFEALNALIGLGEKAIEPCRRLLRDEKETPVRRWQAAKVLGAVKATGAAQDLVKAIGDASNAVRACAAEALGLLGDASAAGALKAALEKERDPMARQAMADAIARLEGRPPAPTPSRPPPPPPAAPDFFESRFDWAPSLEEGLARAKAKGRLLLTVVYAHESQQPTPGFLDRSAIPYHVLLRGPFTDPDLTALLEHRFVLAKVDLHIHVFSADYPAPDPDPLAAVGARCRDVKPLALLVTTPDGKLVHAESGLGTFDARAVHAALRAVLRANRDLAPVPEDATVETLLELGELEAVLAKGSPLQRAHAALLLGDGDATRRWLRKGGDSGLARAAAKLEGKLEHHEGRLDAAGKLLEPLADDDREAAYLLADGEIAARSGRGEALLRELTARTPPDVWSRKAAARLDPGSPDLGQWESYAGSTRPAPRNLEDHVRRALDWLVAHQNRDGSWTVGIQPMPEFNTAAVTAIACSALRDWRKRLAPDARSGADVASQAIDRGLGFLLAYAKDPGTSVTQVFNHTYALELFLDLLDGNPRDARAKEAAQSIVRALRAHQYPGGGFSYLTIEFGEQRFGGRRPHSFNTAPILSELARAKGLGVEVPPEMIEKATAALRAMRSESGAFMYAPPEGFQWMTRPRASIARDPCCELALLAAGKGSPTAVAKAVERFHEHRLDLEIPRELYASYFDSNGHGSYFYTFAYHYAAKGLARVPAPRRKEIAEDLIADLLRVVEADGTWIDAHASGKAYATGMALRALALLGDARR